LLNADKSDSGYITRDQYSDGNQYKIEQTHVGQPPCIGNARKRDTGRLRKIHREPICVEIAPKLLAEEELYIRFVVDQQG
jgi:hypothetical protein